MGGWNKGLTKETDVRIARASKKNSGKNNPMYGKVGYWKGKKQTNESRRKRSESRRGQRAGKNHPFWGKKRPEHSEKMRGDNNPNKRPDVRQKKRLAMIRRLEKIVGQVRPNYNPIACELIDKYGKLHGFAFQHAENGGEFHIKELGYFVDGYDKKRNVVVEVYERAHQRTVAHDKLRQQEIVKYLGCKFIVLKLGDKRRE